MIGAWIKPSMAGIHDATIVVGAIDLDMLLGLWHRKCVRFETFVRVLDGFGECHELTWRVRRVKPAADFKITV